MSTSSAKKRGKRNKLTNAQVMAIFRRANKGERQKVLAAEYNVDQRTISSIKCGARWKKLNLVETKNDGYQKRNYIDGPGHTALEQSY